jgi:hypothetical protein
MYGDILNRSVHLDEFCMEVMLFVGDLDVTKFNPIASTILKWLRFKSVRWMHYLHHSALLNNELGLFSTVGFPWLHHTPPLADVTMEIKACTLPKAVKLN